MKKIILLFTAIVLFAQFNAKADEGMWLLTMLKKNYSDMKKQGFKLKMPSFNLVLEEAFAQVKLFQIRACF